MNLREQLVALLADLEELADLRGEGAEKRRKWEQATNAYQRMLGETYEDWARNLANEIEGAETDDEREELIDAAVAALALTLKRAGEEHILDGAMLGAGGASLSAAFLGKLSTRVQGHNEWVSGRLIPEVQQRLFDAVRNPDVMATGAVAILGALIALQSRVEMAAGTMWTAIQEGLGEQAHDAEEDGEGGRVAWQRDGQAKHCDDCIEFGEDAFPGRVYDSWDMMLIETGGRLPGEVRCSANCRCSLWLEVNGEWTRA